MRIINLYTIINTVYYYNNLIVKIYIQAIKVIKFIKVKSVIKVNKVIKVIKVMTLTFMDKSHDFMQPCQY